MAISVIELTNALSSTIKLTYWLLLWIAYLASCCYFCDFYYVVFYQSALCVR